MLNHLRWLAVLTIRKAHLCFFWSSLIFKVIGISVQMYSQEKQNLHNLPTTYRSIFIIYYLKTYLLGFGWCRMFPQHLETADGGDPTQMNWRNMSWWHHRPTEMIGLIYISVVQIHVKKLVTWDIVSMFYPVEMSAVSGAHRCWGWKMVGVP